MVKFHRQKRRILFAEDNEDAWEIVELALPECKLTFARNFEDGLRLARQGYFDLYILDNWLPGGSGIGLCRAIREFDPYTPILFYSACAYAGDKQAAFSAGAQAYLVNPVSFGELTWAVAQLTSVPAETVFEARRAESAAILEELALRQTAIAERLERTKKKRLRAEEKLLRNKALIAFLAAGGTRGAFAREWLSEFSEEVRCDGTPLRVAIEGER